MLYNTLIREEEAKGVKQAIDDGFNNGIKKENKRTSIKVS